MKNDTEKMNIVFASDNNYAQLMGVALCSIFENKKGNYYINIYVLDGGISKININRLKVLENKYSFEIKYIKINTSYYKDFSIGKNYTQAAYYRVMIPKLLPNIGKVLYLDCDIVVLDDIYELYSTNIDGYAFAAVIDGYCQKRNEELDMPMNEKYFNSGVLLMNIDKCIEIKATEKIIDFINKYPEKLKYVDQDAINATMWGNFFCLDEKYNYITWYKKSEESKIPIDIKKIKIVHYLGSKPWDYFYNDILIQKYFYYLNKTPWNKFKYTNFYKRKIGNFFIRNLPNFEKKALLILSRKNIERIRKIKKKLGIKLY